MSACRTPSRISKSPLPVESSSRPQCRWGMVSWMLAEDRPREKKKLPPADFSWVMESTPSAPVTTFRSPMSPRSRTEELGSPSRQTVRSPAMLSLISSRLWEENSNSSSSSPAGETRLPPILMTTLPSKRLAASRTMAAASVAAFTAWSTVWRIIPPRLANQSSAVLSCQAPSDRGACLPQQSR